MVERVRRNLAASVCQCVKILGVRDSQQGNGPTPAPIGLVVAVIGTRLPSVLMENSLILSDPELATYRKFPAGGDSTAPRVPHREELSGYRAQCAGAIKCEAHDRAIGGIRDVNKAARIADRNRCRSGCACATRGHWDSNIGLRS